MSETITHRATLADRKRLQQFYPSIGQDSPAPVPFDIVRSLEDPVSEIRDFAQLLLMVSSQNDGETLAIRRLGLRIRRLADEVEEARGKLFDALHQNPAPLAGATATASV